MRAISFHSPAVSRATLAIASVAVLGTLATGCGSSSKAGTSALPSTPASSSAPQSSPSADSSADTGSNTNSDKASAYKSVLLTASEVSDITSEQFTAEPSTDDSDQSDAPSGCAALDTFVKDSKSSERGKASASFATADQSMSAEEQLTYVPDQASDLFSQLKDALSTCDTLGSGADSLTLAVQDDPEIQDADDTLAFTASQTGSGHSVVVTGYLARFGDNIVQITYSAVGTEDNPVIGDVNLLTQSASKAATALI